jgi:hypothetical protein
VSSRRPCSAGLVRAVTYAPVLAKFRIRARSRERTSTGKRCGWRATSSRTAPSGTISALFNCLAFFFERPVMVEWCSCCPETRRGLPAIDPRRVGPAGG